MMLLLLILFVVLFAVGLGRKVLVFPYETDFSFVVLIPQNEMGLRAFTLCMRVATELEGEQQIILFAYRTTDYDKLNVWRERRWRFLPPAAHHHLQKVSASPGSPVLGRLPSGWTAVAAPTSCTSRATLSGSSGPSSWGKTRTNTLETWRLCRALWDYVLPRSQIQALHYGHKITKENIFDWATIEYQLNGNVMVVDDE
uniref:Pentraxin (PTX) domain-containing protein n=1 Tax=Salmo trutta TaxID=8032 RepID=A0A673XU83_SALTR